MNLDWIPQNSLRCTGQVQTEQPSQDSNSLKRTGRLYKGTGNSTAPDFPATISKEPFEANQDSA